MLKKAFIIALIVCLPGEMGLSYQGDQFVYTQLRYDGNWDPYPEVSEEILGFIEVTTSIQTTGQRRVISIDDPELYLSPFCVILGKGKFPPLDAKAEERLRNYLYGGGMLFIDDVSGLKNSRFDRRVRDTLARILPGNELGPIPLENAVYRSFYLLRGTGGRKIVSKALLGIERHGRMCVIYSTNDLHGAWARDRLGNPLHDCVPGGEAQRHETKKLLVNIIIFSLTGTYKTDVIHQPFIKQKLKR